MAIHPVIDQVTARIAVRSERTRVDYLQRMRAAASERPARAGMACSNLAHGFAACAGEDRLAVRGLTRPGVAIISSYNDLLSAHQPLHEYPAWLKDSVRAAGGVAQFAGGVPAMCDGITQGQPGMELSLFSREVIAMATGIALSHEMFDAALLLGVCDKIVPGLLIGALAFGHLPAVLVPAGQLHTYKFLVAAQPVLDPINPQRTVLDNGIEWSRFFTQRCAVPVSFEIWELAILVRLTNEILPFESRDAQRFMNLYYFTSDKQAHLSTLAHAYRLEQPIGAANFIDKIVAREERHRFIDYKICLRIIDGLLRRRFPGLTPAQISKDGYRDLYAEMARGAVDGWDVGQYQNPNYFLQILRRHTYMGAFSHPKYGGNAGAAGWAYLEEMFRGPAGESCFNWRRSIELPLGTSADYLG